MTDHREIEQLVEAATNLRLRGWERAQAVRRLATIAKTAEERVRAAEWAMSEHREMREAAEEWVRDLADHYQRKLSDAEAALADLRRELGGAA